jgi:hypothetical protein
MTDRRWQTLTKALAVAQERAWDRTDLPSDDGAQRVSTSRTSGTISVRLVPTPPRVRPGPTDA